MIVVTMEYQPNGAPSGYNEFVAIFDDPDLADLCFPIIEKYAKKHHFHFVNELGHDEASTWGQAKIEEILPEEEE